jgi:hypothetical protein
MTSFTEAVESFLDAQGYQIEQVSLFTLLTGICPTPTAGNDAPAIRTRIELVCYAL